MAALRPLTIRYLTPAEEDIKAIAHYIRAHNPEAAIRVREALLRNLNMLATFPGFGVRQSRRRVRKWVVPGLDYLIYFSVDSALGELIVCRIRHARQRREFRDS